MQPFGHNTLAKIGGCLCLPFFGGSGLPIQHNVAWDEVYLRTKWNLNHPAVWPQQTWAENRGAVPFWAGELGPHLTNVAGAEAYLHAKFHLDPSSRLATIHQRYRQTDRQTDNGLIAYGKPFY